MGLFWRNHYPDTEAGTIGQEWSLMNSEQMDRGRKERSLHSEGVVWLPAVGGKNVHCPQQRPTRETGSKDASGQLILLISLLQ